MDLKPLYSIGWSIGQLLQLHYINATGGLQT
jgi:hypothetical protein